MPSIAAATGYPARTTMPTIIAHHDVEDTSHWLASGNREEFFGPLGVTNIRTFVNPDHPTHVTVMMDVPDLDALKEALKTRESSEAMAHDGVIPESIVMLVES